MSTTQSQVMDHVFALLDQGVYPCLTYAQSYTSGDKLKASQLPYAQAYGPVYESSEDIYLQARGLYTFRLEIIDVVANREALKTALEALAVELARNPSISPGPAFPGLVDNLYMSPASVAETGDNEMTRCAVDVLFELSSMARVFSSDTTWIDLDGKASLVTKSLASDTVVDSTLVPAGLEYNKIGFGAAPFLNMLSSNMFDPIDASLIQKIRAMYYYPPDSVGVTYQATIGLYHQTAGFNGGKWNFTIHAGWNQFEMDLDTPDGTLGSWDRDGTINKVSPQFFFNAPGDVTDDPIIIYRFFSGPADMRV